MAYGTLTFYSNVLGKDTKVDFIMPDTRRRAHCWTNWDKKELKVIWILHGMGDDSNAWIRKSNIELLARKYDVAIFMPSCERECYTDSKRGIKMFSYITNELPIVMKNYFPISNRREDNFVIGNSMGGYGALKCGLMFPEKYAAVASLSGVIDFYELKNGFLNDVIPYVFGTKEEYKNSDND